jgi:hypothetical protein
MNDKKLQYACFQILMKCPFLLEKIAFEYKKRRIKEGYEYFLHHSIP